MTTPTVEARNELTTHSTLLNIGPSHPAMHGVIRIITQLEGETIVKADIEIGYLHRGFEKSCHFEYKFDSRTEQTLSFILENDREVLKWLRPAPNQFRIYWLHNSKLYEPDFVAETADCIYLIETKAANEINDPDVQAKAQAALKYCKYATEYTVEHGGKPWKYILIPHDHVTNTSSFRGVVSPNIFK